MSVAIGSQSWTAISLVGSDVVIGMPMTLSGDGAAMVQATDANLTASQSGIVTAVAISPTTGGRTFNYLATGFLDPTQVPSVGPGTLLDFAVLNNGVIIRSTTRTLKTIGICGKDGSVLLDLSMFGSIGGGGGGSVNGIYPAFTVSALAAGDGVGGANSTVDASRITKWSATAALNNGELRGVALFAATANSLTFYAGIGADVPGSLCSLSPTSAKAYAIVDPATAHVTRKVAPEVGDYILGIVDPNANIHIDPGVMGSSVIVVGSPGYECDLTGTLDCSAAIQRAINDSLVHPPGIRYFQRTIKFPHGRFGLSFPLVCRQGGTVFKGEGPASTTLEANYCGPVLNLNAIPGPIPQVTGFDGGLVYDMDGQQANTEARRWLELSQYGESMYLNGAAAISIQFILKIPAGGAVGDLCFLNSFGRRYSTDPNGGGAEAFKIYFVPTNHLIGVSLWTNTTRIGGITTTANAWADDVWTEVTVVLSAGNVYVYSGPAGIVGGHIVCKTNFNVGGATMLQQTWEALNLGACASPNRYGEVQGETCVKAQVASLKISNVPVITGGTVDVSFYASTGGRFGLDGNTIWQSNFNITYENFTFAATKTTLAGGVGGTWLPTAHIGLNSFGMDSIEVRDMSIHSPTGVGIAANAVNGLKLDNLYITALMGGFLGRNNCYNCSYTNLYITGGGAHARAGMDLGSNCYNAFISASQIWDYAYGVVAKDSAEICGGSYLIRNKIAHIWGYNSSHLNVHGVNLSDEGVIAGNPCTGFLLTGVQSAHIHGNSLGIITAVGPMFDWGDGGLFGNETAITVEANNIGTPAATGGYVRTRTALPESRFEMRNNGFSDGAWNLPILTADSVTNAPVFVYPACEYLTVTLPLADANRTITRQEWFRRTLECTGALTADRTLTAPSLLGPDHIVHNATTGGFNLILKAAGSAITTAVAPGAYKRFASNGTDLINV